MERPRRVLLFCAHSDDQVIGAGGMIAKLSREGAQVRTFICSFGEQSHPHLKPVEVRKTRVLESKRADVILGGSGVMFLGVREGQFPEDFADRRWAERLLRHVREFRPDLIITHSADDPHPDHRAVHKMVLDLYERARLRCEVFTFDIWNVINFKRDSPRMIVDITPWFARKLDALAAFKSQKVALFTLLWSVYAKAVFYGLRSGVRYAEVFYKVR